jgi:bacillithiol biosynthesis cysteine-adding enzyme BshC
MAERAPLILDYGAFPQPPNPLFRDYLAGSERARPFYAGGWGLADLARAADRASAHPRDRERLARALVRQQESRGAPEAAAAAARLAKAETAAVVSGQQPGIFGGPLYVLYKALAALRIAAELEQKRGAPVVPVFWVASDDHDFAEVRSTSVLDETGRIRTLRYAPRREPVGQPASHIVLDDTIAALVDELRRCLAPSPHVDAALARLAASYTPGATLAGAFAQLLSGLLPGLVVLDCADPDLKSLTTPVMSREIREASPTTKLADAAGRSLLANGYHLQVPVRPGFLNLFVLMEGERRSLGTSEGTLEVRGLGKRLPLRDAADLLEKDPAPWSPGALLRPLAQDQILPTAGYVGGPAEIAYHAEIGSAYGHFGIPRPVLVPRPSITLMEPAQARVLETEELQLTDLQADPERLLARWARDDYPAVEAALVRVRASIEADMLAVQEALAAVDPTLAAAAESTRDRALHQIESLREKATRALKKRDLSRAERLRRTRDALFPGGSFQERGLGLIGLVARHGEAIIDEVRQRMDPWARGHQVIPI